MALGADKESHAGDGLGLGFSWVCPGRRCERLRFYAWVRKIPWSRRWQTHSNILAMDRGAWQATVHVLAKSQTWLIGWTHTHTSKPLIPILLLTKGGEEDSLLLLPGNSRFTMLPSCPPRCGLMSAEPYPVVSLQFPEGISDRRWRQRTNTDSYSMYLEYNLCWWERLVWAAEHLHSRRFSCHCGI